jgi:hypothetical protein
MDILLISLMIVLGIAFFAFFFKSIDLFDHI